MSQPSHTARALIIALLVGLVAPALTPAGAQPATLPDVTALAAVVFPGVKSTPSYFGVYLGHGLVLTNWHPWTFDGQYYTGDRPPISPSRSVPRYDDDNLPDPGESLLRMADCDGTWVTDAAADRPCTPFARVTGAGFIFPLAGDRPDSAPIPIERLLYASRAYDIALFAVDPIAVELRSVEPARLSMVPTGADHPVYAAYQTMGQLHATLQTGAPVLLPTIEGRRLDGPWRVPSLVMNTRDPLPHGAPVFDAITDDLIGLTWRAASPDSAQTWVTPAALWIHDLYAANDEIHDEALATVLSEAVSAPADGAPTLGDPLISGLGNTGIDVQHYDLDLAFDLDAGTLSGTATLTIRALYHQLSTFSLDATGLAVEGVTVGGAEVPFAAKEHKLIVQLPAPLDYGTVFDLAIRYHAAPQPVQSPYMPFFKTGMHLDSSRVYTLNEPEGANTWFPCNDHPTDRATYDLALTVPAGLDAISNGTRIADTPSDDGTHTIRWRMDAPMSSYLVLVAVGDYAVIEDQTPDGIPLQHYAYPDSVEAGRALFASTGESLDTFADLFGPYPFGAYGHVVAPVGGMALETQTMTILPDSLLQSANADTMIAHELAHQWFGNAVPMATWADIWLKEGFATHAEWLALESRYGPDSARAARTISEQTLMAKTWADTLADPDPAQLFGAVSYDKGAWVLHMLRREIGDRAFFALLRLYVQTFSARPADTLDFWRLAELVSGQDLSAFFGQWLLQPDIPRYTLYWTAADTGADVLVCAESPNPYRLEMPLRFHQGDQTSDAVMTVETPETRAAFPLGFVPADLESDPAQDLLAQVKVQPIAALPEACPVP